MDKKERHRLVCKKYYENNKQKCCEATRKWKKNNPDKVKEIGKKYREENKDKAKAYREENKDKAKAWEEKNKVYRKEYRENYRKSKAGIKNRLKCDWRRRGVKGNLDELFEIWWDTKECNICGHDFSVNRKCLDHDHKTGEFRYICCHICNVSVLK